MKIWRTITISMAITLYCSFTALAGNWNYDSKGWWFQRSNGSYPSDTWQEIDEKWYFFDADGYMKTGWIQCGDKWYYCKLSGSLATEQWINGTYYVGVDGAMYVNATTPDGIVVGSDGTKKVENKLTTIQGVFRDENIERDNWWTQNKEKVQNDSRIGGTSVEIAEGLQKYYPDCPGTEYIEVTIENTQWSLYEDTGFKGMTVDEGTVQWSGDGNGVLNGDQGQYSVSIIDDNTIQIDGLRYIRE